MKKFICACALILASVASIGAAQSQVYFGSGSDRPINPGAAKRDDDRQQRVRAPVRVRERLVRCVDGTRRVARLCRRHGGGARR